MKNNKKGLQKLTEAEIKVQELLKKRKVVEDDVNNFSNEERQVLASHLQNLINNSKGDEREDLLWKIDDIMPKDTKNQLWENNHYIITQSISKLIEDHGKMPTKNNIAADTGLSRNTIHKHLKGYAEHPLYADQLQQFKFMADRIMAKVIKMAVQGEGNVKAARLYFEMMGNLNNGQPSNKTLIQNQNNYIQINGKVLSQETIKNLNPDQLQAIETILLAASPKSKTE